MVNERTRVQRASPTVWMVVVALVVAAAWWYPTVRDEWLLPKPDEATGGSGGMSFTAFPTPQSITNEQGTPLHGTAGACAPADEAATAIVPASTRKRVATTCPDP